MIDKESKEYFDGINLAISRLLSDRRAKLKHMIYLSYVTGEKWMIELLPSGNYRLVPSNEQSLEGEIIPIPILRDEAAAAEIVEEECYEISQRLDKINGR